MRFYQAKSWFLRINETLSQLLKYGNHCLLSFLTEKALGPPSFIKQLADVTVIEGCSIVLECEVAEVDSVSWYKDWIIQRNSADFKQTFDGEKARLEIGEIFLDDEGIYTCAIKNCNGECRSSCKVSVKGKKVFFCTYLI